MATPRGKVQVFNWKWGRFVWSVVYEFSQSLSSASDGSDVKDCLWGCDLPGL